jgi:ABC-type multidrug transport system ATPase subunit
MSAEVVIDAAGLTKRYRDVLAVDDLSLQVRRGEIYGLLGRNGAGKTTTIRMLLGLIRPTSGEVRVLGRPVSGPDRTWLREVGFLVETATAYPTLTVRENLDLHRRLVGALPASVDTAIELLRLAPYANRRAGRLSLGNKQRLSLARALLHTPRVLVLDEPVNALDPAGVVEIRELLLSLADEQGVAVFLSSHNLSEVAHVADRIGIVHEGRLIEEAPRDELADRARKYVGDAFTPEQREQDLLTADLERYFLARTEGEP